MEQSAFQRDKALSTPHELVYTGPIESLAKNVGYTCWDAKGKPLDYGLGFRTKPPHTEPLKGEWITGGDLGFDLEKTRVVLTQLGVITGKESANSCSWDKNKPVNPARFRLFSEVDQLVDDAGELSKKDLHKSLRSARKGALVSGKRVMDKHVKENMKACLTDIQSGKFANDWMNEYKQHGFKKMQEELDVLAKHRLETIGVQIRKAMWPNENRHQ